MRLLGEGVVGTVGWGTSAVNLDKLRAASAMELPGGKFTVNYVVGRHT